MKYSVRATNDVESVIKLHKLLFSEDYFPTQDENTCYWLIKCEGKNVGFGVARIIEDGKTMFLARAGVLHKHTHKGLHKRLVKCRENLAKRIGCKSIVTYVAKDNTSSFVNLIKYGYEIYEPDWDYAGEDFFYFLKKVAR